MPKSTTDMNRNSLVLAVVNRYGDNPRQVEYRTKMRINVTKALHGNDQSYVPLVSSVLNLELNY